MGPVSMIRVSTVLRPVPGVGAAVALIFVVLGGEICSRCLFLRSVKVGLVEGGALVEWWGCLTLAPFQNF